MSTNLDAIVNPVITEESSGISGAGFGTVLVAASLPSAVTTLWGPDVVREYTSAKDMLAVSEGFTVNDAAYKLVASIFAQNPKPKKVKVGKRATAQTQTLKLTPTNTTIGFVYSGTIGGKSWTYTVNSSDGATVSAICTALATLWTGLAVGVTATQHTTYVGCVSTAGLVVEYTFGTQNPNAMTVEDDTADPGITADLNAIEAADPDWYGLVIDSFGAAENEAAAAWADSQGMVNFCGQCADSAVVTAAYSSGSPADQASYLKAHGRARVTMWWNQDMTFANLASSIIGKMSPKTPGTFTYQYKNLVGPAPSDHLTATQIAKLTAKNCNYYSTIGNVARTVGGGKVSAGEYTDVVIFLDWWRNTVQVQVAAYLVSKDKVVYDDAGVQSICDQIDFVNDLGVQNSGILKGSYSTTAPKVADISSTDKAARTLTGVAVTFQLAQAIYFVDPITVTVTL